MLRLYRHVDKILGLLVAGYQPLLEEVVGHELGVKLKEHCVHVGVEPYLSVAFRILHQFFIVLALKFREAAVRGYYFAEAELTYHFDLIRLRDIAVLGIIDDFVDENVLAKSAAVREVGQVRQ